MILPITSVSALDFWLFGSELLQVKKISISDRNLISLPSGFKIETDGNFIRDFADEYSLSLPLHIMAENKNGRQKNRLLHCHVLPNKIPEDSFIRLDKTVYISSPELSLLQSARYFSLPKLVEIATNLCAQYVKSPKVVYYQSHREPLINAKSLKKYYRKTENVEGIKKARLVVKYVLDGSNSPMESKLAVLIVLPRYYGGYALGRPEMNRIIYMTSKKAAAILGRDYCCCDIVWPKEKVILEYDSNLTHLTKDQHSYDKRKYTALTLMGYKVITVTASQLKTFYDVELLFDSIRVALNLQSRKERMKKYEEIRRQTVEEILFSPDPFGHDMGYHTYNERNLRF